MDPGRARGSPECTVHTDVATHCIRISFLELVPISGGFACDGPRCYVYDYELDLQTTMFPQDLSDRLRDASRPTLVSR